jgi:tRNA 2-thiouridine synthesizing protein A
VIAIQMGSKDAPHCPSCLAGTLGTPLEAFLERSVRFLERRECYGAAWQRACEREGQEPERPACLWAPARPGTEEPARAPRPEPGEASAEVHWDVGDEGCGDLALALRRKVQALPPRTLLVVRATDPGAAHDIPAWCRLAGHSLLHADPPTYRLRTKP